MKKANTKKDKHGMAGNNYTNGSMMDLYEMGVFAKTFGELKNENNSEKQTRLAMVLLFGLKL